MGPTQQRSRGPSARAEPSDLPEDHNDPEGSFSYSMKFPLVGEVIDQRSRENTSEQQVQADSLLTDRRGMQKLLVNQQFKH